MMDKGNRRPKIVMQIELFAFIMQVHQKFTFFFNMECDTFISANLKFNLVSIRVLLAVVIHFYEA